MNRREKEEFVKSLKTDFRESAASFLIGYKGMDVAQVTNLRRRLRDKGGSMQVAKLTLIRRAIEGAPIEDKWSPFLKEQLALVFSQADSASIAKVLRDFASEQDHKLSVIAGCMEDKFLSAQLVSDLASLPSKEIMLATVCGTIKAPVVAYVMLLKKLILRFLWVLKEIENKKSV